MKLERVQEGEEVLGVLTEEHLALREDSVRKSQELRRYTRRVEKRLEVLHEEHHDEEEGCPQDCEIVRPTEEEKRTVHQLNYDAKLANMVLWKRLNDDFKAWEMPVGLRENELGQAVLVKLRFRNPIIEILGGMIG